VFGSDQGLVGQFNESVVQFAAAALHDGAGAARVVAIGERAQARLTDVGLEPMRLFNVPASVEGVAPLVGHLLEQIDALQAEEQISEVHLFYNRRISGGTYEPTRQQLLPLDEDWLRRLAVVPWPTKNLPEVMGESSATLRALLHEYLFISLFRACANSLASENASRLAAMQRAERNIEELLDQLQDALHRVRQSAIDEELFDVISGFESLSG
jgi:F-type H+-transporting ATPase subunit gamma